jgi:hypothetical protein
MSSATLRSLKISLSESGWMESNSLPNLTVEIDPTSDNKDIMSIKYLYQDVSGIYSETISTDILENSINQACGYQVTVSDFINKALRSMKMDEVITLTDACGIFMGPQRSDVSLCDIFVGQLGFYIALTVMLNDNVLWSILPFQFDLPHHPHDITRSSINYIQMPFEAGKVGCNRMIGEISWLINNFYNGWGHYFKEGDQVDMSKMILNLTMKMCLAAASKVGAGPSTEVEDMAMRKDIIFLVNRVSELEARVNLLEQSVLDPMTTTIEM